MYSYYYSWQLLALIISASFAIPFSLADFHIAQVVDAGTVLLACPSNYFNCDCFQNTVRAAEVSLDGEEEGSLPKSFSLSNPGFVVWGS